MECSQDHFTYDTLDGHVGDESNGVVDGEIYYLHMIFLTWIFKHKKKDLIATHSSFLFMGLCHITMEGSFMGLINILISVHGNNWVFSLTDYLTQYLHSVTISIQCISP